MKTLSIFLDEIGTIKRYEEKSPYYVFTMLFYEQPIQNIDVSSISFEFSEYNNTQLFHCGPLIRKEGLYKHVSTIKRRNMFNSLYSYSLKAPITFKEFIIPISQEFVKDHFTASSHFIDLVAKFFDTNLDYFKSFDNIYIYYDKSMKKRARWISYCIYVHLDNVYFKEKENDSCICQLKIDQGDHSKLTTLFFYI